MLVCCVRLSRLPNDQFSWLIWVLIDVWVRAKVRWSSGRIAMDLDVSAIAEDLLIAATNGAGAVATHGPGVSYKSVT